MAAGELANKNVIPRHPSTYYEEEHADAGSAFAESGGDTRDDQLSEDMRSQDDEDSGSDPREQAFSQQITNVSFDALLQAQNALSRKRKRGSNNSEDQDAKLETVRRRLQEIRSQKEVQKIADSRAKETSKTFTSSRMKYPDSATASKNDKHQINPSMNDESDSDSAPSEEESKSKPRTSKHAPSARSSKHQVTRKRTVIDVPKRVTRDPRFDALHQSSAHPGNSEKAYGFLRDYQKSEISELKAAIKQTPNEDEKEILKRKLDSMENRVKTEEAKEREQKILREHRREEREKVEQGKKPFFLKKRDLKERAQVERFKGMKKKDQVKLIDKRRKKEGQREKKRMPETRRFVG